MLEQKAGGAGGQRVEDVLVQVIGGQDHDVRVEAHRGEPTGGLDAVESRHPDVHQHHVGAKAARGLDRRQPVFRFADHLDVRLGLEDHAKAGAHQRLVVDDQNADRHQAAGLTGSRATTANPPPGRGPALKAPPKSATRSRMPMIP